MFQEATSRSPSGREQVLPKPVNSFLSFYIIPQHLCRVSTAFKCRIIASFLGGLDVGEGGGAMGGHSGTIEQMNS